MAAGRSLSDSVREGLLRRVNAARDAAVMRAARAEAPRPPPGTSNFSRLPGFEELRFYHQLGEKLGVGNPYFRLHEGRAGAETRINGRSVLNFASYDYLGLNGHPEIIDAVHAAIDQYGVSSSGSRCVAGERPIHRRLEQALAAFHGVDDSAAFVSGYATNLSVIGQLLGPKDLLLLDSFVHNSAVMGGVLSGANRRSFPHNDLDNLEQMLARHRARHQNALIVVEGLYSMDGDYPDLPRLIDLKERYDAWLMVDEAHAIGVLGRTGRGIAEHFGVDGRRVDIWMGTLSKTLAACGGYIAGSAALIDYLKNFAGAFAYSVAMPPAIAAAAEKALKLLQQEPERVARLQHNAGFFKRRAAEAGLDTGDAVAAVMPVFVGDSLPSVMLSERLLSVGINVLPVFHPAVPPKRSRVRFFVSAMHSEDDIATAIDTTAEVLKQVNADVKALAAKQVGGLLFNAR